MKSMVRLLSIAGVIVAAAPAANGALTYVDAIPDLGPGTGNTRITDPQSGLPVTMVPEPTEGFNYTVTTNSGIDNLWHYRHLTGINLVNGENIWQSDAASSGEDTQALVTTLTGLVPGEYRIYVAFWGGQQPTSNWDIAARIGDTGEFTVFKHRDSPAPDLLDGFIYGGLGIDTTEDGSEFTNTDPAVITRAFAGTPSHLLYGSLGTVMIDDSGSVSVYVQGPDVDAILSGERRTYYEGLIYEAVPEPRAMALMIAGSIACLVGRRWQHR